MEDTKKFKVEEIVNSKKIIYSKYFSKMNKSNISCEMKNFRQLYPKYLFYFYL